MSVLSRTKTYIAIINCAVLVGAFSDMCQYNTQMVFQLSVLHEWKVGVEKYWRGRTIHLLYSEFSYCLFSLV